MSSIRLIFAALCLAMLVGMHPAAALTIDSSSDTNHSTANLTDPDNQLDEMADGSGTSPIGILHFSGGDMSSSSQAGGNVGTTTFGGRTTSALNR